MLKIYLDEPQNVITANDSYFNRYTFQELDYKQAKEIIKSIDGVDLINDFKIKSQFTDGELDLSKLSTGCKTALNVVTYPEKNFTAIECGLNALNVIYQKSIGNIYMRELITSITENINCDILVIAKNGEKAFSDTKSMCDWYVGEYKNEDETSDY